MERSMFIIDYIVLDPWNETGRTILVALTFQGSHYSLAEPPHLRLR